MSGLAISKTVSLPLDVVTQKLGSIGRTGSGKTYLAGLLAEQMLDAKAQIVVLDPVGNWWGLRLAADGKSKGKDIFVAGGEYGDVPVLPESGARFARLVVEKHVSMVLDVSGFRQGERKRFAADFAEEFFHLKKNQRSAVHLFIEEAQLFIPQRSGLDEARMLGAFENIVRLGRNYGIGSTLISQRPQSVNKEVLSQVECLFALQVNGTHERKALDEWVQEAGADRTLVNQLPSLKRGEGFIWSPSWLRIFERVQFGQKVTFDASATPEVGKAARAAVLTSVDVEALRADLQEVITSAEKDDPKSLRRRIAELEAENRKKSAQPEVVKPDPAAVEMILLDALNDFYEQMHQGVGTPLADQITKFIESLSRFEKALRDKELWKVEALTEAHRLAAVKMPMVPDRSTPAPLKLKPEREWPKPAPPSRDTKTGNSSLSGPEQRILNAIAWFESIGVNDPEQPAVAFLAGYTYGGGAYNNPRGKLNVAGHIEYVAGERIRLTASGKRLAVYPDQPQGDAELQTAVLARLPGPERRLLQPLLTHYPEALSNESLARAAQYTPGAGAFNNPKGRLRSLGLIEYPSPGMVRAKDLLFPESAVGAR